MLLRESLSAVRVKMIISGSPRNRAVIRVIRVIRVTRVIRVIRVTRVR